MNKPFILLVDDEPEILNAIVMLLKGHFNVYAVNRGKDALEVIRLIKVDCLITDMNMPQMDGLELLENIRDAGFRIKTIVAYGGCDDLLRDRLRELGVNGCLQKPFRIDDLMEMVEGILSDSVEEQGYEFKMIGNGDMYGQ